MDSQFSSGFFDFQLSHGNGAEKIEISLRKSGIYDKTYGCLDIGFVVVWGRMDSKASTQNAIVENEDS